MVINLLPLLNKRSNIGPASCLALQVCEHLHSGAVYIWDEEMQVPYMIHGDQWVGFDDERAIRNKMKFLMNNGYGGAMVWTLDLDDFKGDTCGGNVKYPLISIMRYSGILLSYMEKPSGIVNKN